MHRHLIGQETMFARLLLLLFCGPSLCPINVGAAVVTPTTATAAISEDPESFRYVFAVVFGVVLVGFILGLVARARHASGGSSGM